MDGHQKRIPAKIVTTFPHYDPTKLKVKSIK